MASMASSTGDDSVYVLTHVIDMLESSASVGEVSPLKQP
jgi:hypothetical protein